MTGVLSPTALHPALGSPRDNGYCLSPARSSHSPVLKRSALADTTKCVFNIVPIPFVVVSLGSFKTSNSPGRLWSLYFVICPKRYNFVKLALFTIFHFTITLVNCISISFVFFNSERRPSV
ncbi:hypothetical protein QWA68_006327 [Fusarium oxysporum]|nr:hypothetical protein QWA68_006327 [Fusarium oxysporum]